MADDTLKNQERFEQIERYVMGHMQNEELADFEKRLKTDGKLQGKVQEYKVLVAAVEEKSLLNKLDEFHNTLDNTEVKELKTPFSFKKYAIAASIALLLGFGSFWFFSNQNTNQKLYTKYFKPDPGLPTVMSSSNNYRFYEAMVDYKRGNYDVAIKKWEELLVTKPENDTLNYFVGSAYLANENHVNAIPYLQKVLEQNNSMFINDAHYYLGLAHLKNDNIDLVKKQFSQIKDGRSREILSKINN